MREIARGSFGSRAIVEAFDRRDRRPARRAAEPAGLAAGDSCRAASKSDEGEPRSWRSCWRRPSRSAGWTRRSQPLPDRLRRAAARPNCAETRRRSDATLARLPDLLPVLGELAALPPDVAAALRRAAACGSASSRPPSPIARSRNLSRRDRRLGPLRRPRPAAAHARAARRALPRVAARPTPARSAAAGARAVPRARAAWPSCRRRSSTAEQKEFKRRYNQRPPELEHEFGKTMRYRSIRDLVGRRNGLVVRDLKPVWLMSPLSVSDTLPLGDRCCSTW